MIKQFILANTLATYFLFMNQKKENKYKKKNACVNFISRLFKYFINFVSMYQRVCVCDSLLCVYEHK